MSKIQFKRHLAARLMLFAATCTLGVATALAATAPSQQNTKARTSTGLKRYINNSNTTQRITLNFTNIQTRQLLQLFSQFTDSNFIISNKVTGTMSIHLKNIPWTQALTAILKSQGLAQRRLGDTVIIAPASEIKAERMEELNTAEELRQLQIKRTIQTMETRNKIQQLEPLSNRVMILKNANAEDIAKMLTNQGTLLTARGSIGFDARSNSIWIRDNREHINTIIRLIKKLDFIEKQVAIETRIVTIDRPFERQLGIKWGVSSKANRLSGTLLGANKNLTQALDTIPVPERLNFNLPVTNLQDSTVPAGTLGIALGQLGDFNVDLELSALEEEGKVQLVSKPRLVTSNLQPAYIETGQEIPYQEATSSGATAVSFKQASLILKVTPRITSGNRVLLNITVSNNKRGRDIQLNSVTGAIAIPIDKEEEQSTILVNNKQTIVLGGVYHQDKRKIITRIPFLGRIPLIGYLFKHTLIRNNRRELLIFLTPRIIHTPKDLNKE